MTYLRTPLLLALVALVAGAAGCSDDTGSGPASNAETGPDGVTDVAAQPDTPMVEGDGLQIIAIEPERGPTQGLVEVQLQGQGFDGAVELLFGQSPATEFFVVNDALIVALTPPRGRGSVDVTVIDEQGTRAVLPRGFLYRDNVMVTQVEPSSGHRRGGEPITVHGEGFAEGAQVLIGGRAAPSVEVVDGNTIAAVTPEGDAGQVSLFVSSADGVAELPGGFGYYDTPRIRVVTPAAGQVTGGQPIDVIGDAFVEPVSVRLGGAPLLDMAVLGPGHLRGTTPASAVAGPVDVVVSTPHGTAFATKGFTYLADDAPQLALVSAYPARGPIAGGNQVTLVVTGLEVDASPSVRFGSRDARVVSVDPPASVVTVEAPPGLSAGVVVLTLTSTTSVTLQGAYAYEASPTIASVSPDRGPAGGGTPFTVTGTDFGPGSSVRVGALPATGVRVVDAQTITATSPPGSPGPASVTVRSQGAEAIAADAFHYDGPPAVWVVDPPLGAMAGGTRVRILGSGFPTVGAQVTFGGAPATEVVVSSSNELSATTPPGQVGAVAVTVRGAGVEAAHPNGFAYFDPASTPGTWGGELEGNLNVTVLNGSNGLPVPAAAVVVGPEVFTELRGSTDERGQITFSGSQLRGDQTVTVSRSGFQTRQIAGFNAPNVTLMLDPVPQCSDVPEDFPCEQVFEPGPSAILRGRIVGGEKGPSMPWGQCADYPDAPEGLCRPCTSNDACETGVCTQIPEQGFFCSAECTQHADCAAGFACVSVAGGPQGKCLPPAPDVLVFCDVTNGSLFDDDPIAYPGVPVDGDLTFETRTRLGNFAVYCWRGAFVNSEFRVQTLGVTRGLGAFEDGAIVETEIRLDIPLSKRVDLAIDRPRIGGFNSERTLLRTLLNLGGDGVLEFPPQRSLQSRVFALKLPEALSGPLYDASYDFFINVEATDIPASSSTIERGITRIDNDIDYRLTDDGWQAAQSIPLTTRGITAQNDQTIAVGAGGRIARSFADGFWTTQTSGTELDLHAVAALPGGTAIAVGESGVATHYDGFRWNVAETPTLATLQGVALVHDTLAYAVADDSVLAWDGAVWTVATTTTATLHGIWSAGDEAIWVVGDAGYVGRLSASGWSAVTPPTTRALRAVWASATDDVWLVGDAGTVVHFDGQEFEAHTTPTAHDLHAVWGRSATEVYAVGARGTILHFDGHQWTDRSRSESLGTLRAVGGAPGAIWAMGSHEFVLGPMLAIPENVQPDNGGLLEDTLSWTVQPSPTPHFTAVEFGGASGPCVICGFAVMLPYTEWATIADGDLNQLDFPRMGAVPGGSGFSWGFKEATIYRVLLGDRFDFNDTAGGAFAGSGWKSWATRTITVTTN